MQDQPTFGGPAFDGLFFWFVIDDMERHVEPEAMEIYDRWKFWVKDAVITGVVHGAPTLNGKQRLYCMVVLMWGMEVPAPTAPADLSGAVWCSRA